MPVLKSEFDVRDPRVVSAIDDLPLWSAPFGLKLFETIELRRGMRALDVGCGIGFPIVDLSQRLGPTCTVVGIDPWTAALDRLREKMRTWGVANVEIMEGVVEELPFEDGTFDLVTSNNGTNNVDDEAKAFAEIARVSKADAQFVFTVNLPETMIEFYRVYRNVLWARGLEKAIARMDEHIFQKRKPVPHVRAQVEGAGFDIRNIHEDKFTFRYTDGTAMLNHYFIRLSFADGWKAILEPDEVGPVFDDIELALNEVAARHGVLEMTVPFICVDCQKKRIDYA